LIFALTPHQSEIVVGGVFNTIGNPPLASRALGRYSETGVPWLTQQPSNLAVECQASAAFTVQTAASLRR
jgi:hypothetical protein